MLPRRPTRVELKAEDKEEYEALKRRRQEAQQIAQATQDFGIVQVEIKLRLPDQKAYAKVSELLAPTYRATYAQENYFFDGAGGELSSQRVVMRLRFYNKDEKAIITVKGKAVMQDGVSRATEEEEAVAPELARHYLEHPNEMLAGPKLVQEKQQKFNLSGLKALGGFKNLRKEFEWEGLVLELDETQYEWGTLYEIECETDEPDVLKPKLEALLKQAGVDYSYSSVSKFANFIHKSLL